MSAEPRQGTFPEPEREQGVHPDRASPSPDLERARDVLLCLPYGIGDIIMQTPVLAALRAAATRARIRAVGARPAIELLEDDPRVDELFAIQEWGLTHWADEGTPEIRTRLHAWLSELEPEIVLNPLDAVLALRRAVWSSGRHAFDRDGAAERKTIAGGGGGMRALCVATEQGWGLPIPMPPQPTLHLHDRHRENAHRRIGEAGLDDARLVGISPVASSPLKRWPPRRLARVADALAEHHDRHFLLFAGPDAGPAREVRSHMESVARVLTIGSVHLAEVAALLDACDLFIGNDTGLMHMAAAMETPTLATFGPTSPDIYLPPYERAISVGGRRVPCRHRRTDMLGPPGCWGSDHCLIRDRSCIEEVGIDEVLSRAEEQLTAVSAQAGPIDAPEPEPTRSA